MHARRAVGIALGLLAVRGDAREHEDRLESRLESGHHVGVHPVADHRGVLGVGLDRVQRRTHHQWVRLADEVGVHARGAADQSRHGAGGGERALLRGSGRVGVGGDEAGAQGDESDRLRDPLEAVGARLAEDHVVRVTLAEGVARLVEGGREARFPDDERRAAWPLVLEEAGGGERGGPDGLLGYLETAGPKPGGEVAPRVDRVVGQDQERGAVGPQRSEEVRRTGNGVLLVYKHAVHVHQPRLDLPSSHAGSVNAESAGSRPAALALE